MASKVLMPHLLQKNADLTKARQRLRNSEISTGQYRKLTRDAGRQFDLRCARTTLWSLPCAHHPRTAQGAACAACADAATIRAAKEVANETGEVPLRRIVSSDESWTKLEQYARTSGISLANYMPKPLRTGTPTVGSQGELDDEPDGERRGSSSSSARG